MKILFTGGGTGGHFYPIIAVAEKVNLMAEKEKLLEVKLFYMSNTPYDSESLYQQGLEFVPVPSGKLRNYFSIKNFFDLFKICFGVIIAIFKMFTIYPDVVFAKGGYASFPALFAARLLRIPVIVHESDSIPGRVTKWAGKFAKKVAVSFEQAGKYFPTEKTAWIGQPIRGILQKVVHEGAFEYLKLDPQVPVILVLGGSQGAKIINDAILETLPDLLNRYQIIHQVGVANMGEINVLNSVALKDHPYVARYKPFAFLNPLAMRMAAGAASIIVSRAGSTIFEIATWGLPSIIIPLSNSHGDHQKYNAYNYARAGACSVIEESNLTSHLLTSEIDRLIGNKEKMAEFSKNAKAFSKPDAAERIAKEIIELALKHEK